MRASILSITAALALTACQGEKKKEGDDDKAVAAASAGTKDRGAGEANEPKTPALPEADALLEQAVVASGGREKIGAIESFHFTGKVAAETLGITGTVETWWKEGDFYMVQTIEGLGINRSGKRGDVIWTEEPINGLRKLSGQEAEQHSWFSSPMLAAEWKTYFAAAETTKERKLDDRPVYDVTLTSKSGGQLVLTLDKESHLVVAQSFDVVNPQGKTPVTTKIGDYRDVEGVKIPYEQHSDLGVMKLSQKLTDVEFNVDVDTARFAMPVGDTEVVEAKPTR